MGDFLGGRWGKGLLEYVFLEIVTVLMVRRDPSVAARCWMRWNRTSSRVQTSFSRR